MFKKIISSTVSQILSKAITAIIAIFFISLLTNYLTIELFGMYNKIYNYIGIFVFLADLGLYAIMIREITNNKNDSKKIVGNVMTLRLILGINILFIAGLIAYFLPGYNSTLALISIFIVSIFTIFQLINSSILALMQANMKIEFSAYSLILGKIINLLIVGIIAFVFYPKEIIENSSYFTPFLYIMVAGVISVIINTILNYWYARKIVKFGFSFDWEYIKYIFKIALPYGLALFLSVVFFKIDIIILSLIEGDELGNLSIALYSLPMKIVEVLIVLGGFYMTSLLPSLTKAFKEKDNKTLDKITNVSFKILFASGTIIFVLGVLFREHLIRIIANENYIITSHFFNSSDAFLIVFAVVVFNFFSLFFIYCLVASNKQSKLLKINIFVAIFNIIGNIIFIPHYSFIGAGVITLISQILLTGLGYYYTKGLINFKLPIGFIIKNILLGFIIYLIGYFLINNYSVNIYFDFLVYGTSLFISFTIIYYFKFKK